MEKFKFAYIEHYKINPSKEKYEKYVINAPKYDYSSLIHILDNYKLNQIGVSKYAISQKWFYDHENDEYMTRLKNNTLNFSEIIVLMIHRLIFGQHLVNLKKM